MIFIFLVSQTKLPVRNFSSKNLRGYPKNDVDSWKRGKKLVKIADVVYGRPLGVYSKLPNNRVGSFNRAGGRFLSN